MKNLFSILSVTMLLAACSTGKIISTVSPVNSLSALEQTQGWQSLFNGTDLTNWRGYGGKPAGSAWKAENGTIYLDTDARKQGATGGDLVSVEEFDNFHIKFEWKIAPKGNSGLIFYVNEDTARFRNTYNSGPEYQVLDNDGHADAKIIKHRAGDLYDLVTAKENLRPVGEWNAAEIIADKGNLEFWLNGQKTLTTTMWDDNWRNMIANSKFKAWPGFGSFNTGRFALQDHGDKVWYRDIKIRKL